MSTFEASLNAFDEILGERLDAVQRGAATVVANAVAEGAPALGLPGTPVDTGFARSSWAVGVNGPPRFGTSGRRVDGAPVPPAPDLTAALVAVGAEDTVLIANNAEYIEPLEFGRSSQAPAGFVRLTVAAFPRIVSAVARRVGSGR